MAGDLAARRPALVLAAALLATSVLGLGIVRLDPHVDFIDTVPAGPEVDAYRHLLDRLDGVRFVALYMAHNQSHGVPQLRSDEGFDALVREQGSLVQHLQARFPAGTFSHTLSVHEAMRSGSYMFAKMATAGNPPESSYAVPSDPATYALVRDRVRANDVDDLLAQDGSSAIMLVFLATTDPGAARELAGRVGEEATAWAQSHPHPATADPLATGLLATSHATDERNKDDLAPWALLATLCVGVTLLLIVRRPGNVLVATVSLAAATGATFGLVGWLGIPINFLTVFLAPLVTGIGLDYAVHILHRSEQLTGNGRAGLAQALREVGPGIAASAATTVLGLLVLAFLPAPLFAQIGLVGAVGVALGFATSLTLAPALRAVLPFRRTAAAPRDRIGDAVAAVGAWAIRRRAVVFTGVALLLLSAGTVAVTQSRIEAGSAENEFPQDDPVILLQHRVEREYGAFQRAYIVVEGPIDRAETLRALDAAVARAGALPLHRSASAVTALIRADAATDDGALDIILGTAGQQQGLPSNDAEARTALDSLFADPLWRALAPFTVTRDYRLAVVAVQIDPWQDQQELTDVRDALRGQADTLRADLGPDFQVHAAGAPVNRAAVVEQTPVDVVAATVGVAAVVAACLTVAWRKRPRGFRHALGAAGIALAAALMLVASIPLLDGFYAWRAAHGGAHNSAALTDMFLLALAVTVCVGVDGYIQFAQRTWREGNVVAAMRGAGRSVTGTALTTFAAFAPLAGLYFLQSKNLAILTALGAVYAYGLTLMLAPILLRPRRGASTLRVKP